MLLFLLIHKSMDVFDSYSMSGATNDSGTGVVQIGTTADPNAFMSDTNVKALGVTHTGGTTVAAKILEQVMLLVRQLIQLAKGDGTTGVATVTILYMQNNNLS
jgi:hypothetical protein